MNILCRLLIVIYFKRYRKPASYATTFSAPFEYSPIPQREFSFRRPVATPSPSFSFLLFQFPRGNSLSSDRVTGVSGRRKLSLFQFPRGNSLSSDVACPATVTTPVVEFQFPRGNSLSSDEIRRGLIKERERFQFPRGNSLSGNMTIGYDKYSIKWYVSIPQREFSFRRLRTFHGQSATIC